MIVYITGSARDSGDDLPYLRKLVDIIHASGNEIANNWIEAANHTATHSPKKQWNWKEIVDNSHSAIERSDVLIVETTTYAFFQGYQLALALTQSKPVLVISRKPIDDLAISGIESPLLKAEEYSDQTELEALVEKFLLDFAPKKREIKLNISGNSKLQHYLKDKTQNSDKTEDQILLELANTGLKLEQ
jgi:hypothetical protein